MAIQVRRATGDDVAAIVALQEAVAAELKWIAARPGADPSAMATHYQAVLEAKRRALFVVPSESAIVGVLSIEVAPYGVADFGMFVDESQRGRGLGRALLSAALDWARDKGAHKVTLECWPHNVAAITLYEKFGFVVEGRKRRHYRRGGGDAAWDSLIMGLLLDPNIPGSPYGDGPSEK